MRSKQTKFSENASRANILEPGKDLYSKIKGSWNVSYFHREAPIVVEIGCGRGEYTVGLARLFPERNFIGVDIKGDRLWYGAGIATEEGLENVGFLRARIEQIDQFFAPKEVSEIWITFPGPRPKQTQANRRLTTDKFLDLYKQMLARNGIVHLKTDSKELMQFTQEVLASRNDIRNLEETNNLYTSMFLADQHEIQTHFERKFLAEGKPIHYLRFRFSRS